MAHYALIDENNIVVNVITGVDENITQTDTDGSIVGGSTEAWEAFYESRPWFAGLRCKRSSYNTVGNVHLLNGTPFRKNSAGIGYFYDEVNDAFIPPKLFDSWTLNEETFIWEAPIPRPNDGLMYQWNEDTQDWEAINFN